ncbi:MAG: DUF1176 domain-containing protein [Deltaproteobacteria bacterium]|nr:DUF1176 domain-containing protein [Deltaproteobacteria bacterium]
MFTRYFGVVKPALTICCVLCTLAVALNGSAATPAASTPSPPVPDHASIPQRLARDAGRNDLNYSERGAWRGILHWPAQCESSFNYPDANFGGIQFYQLGNNDYLAMVICTLGTYQGSQVFIRIHPYGWLGQVRTILLKFAVLKEDGESELLHIDKTNQPWGVAEFQPATRHLTLLDRFRGVGDCGIWSVYAFPDHRTKLIAARAKLTCDGQKANQPATWPDVTHRIAANRTIVPQDAAH